MQFQNLPLGSSSFEALRSSKEIYVDKTDLIFQLASSRGKIFLARPRRFGKSLLVSTFESLFEKGTDFFPGLSIQSLWQDKKYPVIRLDFSEVKEFSDAVDFRKNFESYLAQKFLKAGFVCKNSENFFVELSSWLDNLPTNSLVILIDEYDAALTVCLDSLTLLNEIKKVMSRFFLVLKANEGCLRFFFMTGITKFSNTSIFSAFNNLVDISMDPKYGTILGYTESELKKNFGDYLNRASDVLLLSPQELIVQLRRHYNGFCFDEEAATSVYCPWSVLNFLNRPERGFQNYWYQSAGQPSVLLKYLSHHPLSEPMSYSQEKEVRLTELQAARQYDDIGLEALLAQAGYLTIKNITPDRYAILGYPNQEVAVSMAELYANELLKGQRLKQNGAPYVADVLARGTVNEVVATLNAALNAIDYQRYPIVDEASCRAYLQVLLIGAAMMPKVEIHTALGRSDMELDAGKRHWVFEFKYVKTAKEVTQALKDGVEQMSSRRYGMSSKAKELRRLVLVFSRDERRFVASQEVVDN